MAFSDFHLYYDDVEIGQEFRAPGRTVTQADIVNFAGVSGDFNPIHMDHEFAKTTPFRKPISHGLLIFCIASGMAVSYPPMRTVAFIRVREWNFREPVFIGDTVHLISKVLEKNPRSRGRRAEMAWQRLIYNQEGRIVQDGVLITIVEGRALRKPETPDKPDASEHIAS